MKNRYEFEHETLPDIRRAIQIIGSVHADGGVPTHEVARDTRNALYMLLGVVHDLADQVDTLEAAVG